eukprot:scaffold3332_cov39-Prasinocladus_malaysianus.AAC.3
MTEINANTSPRASYFNPVSHLALLKQGPLLDSVCVGHDILPKKQITPAFLSPDGFHGSVASVLHLEGPVIDEMTVFTLRLCDALSALLFSYH